MEEEDLPVAAQENIVDIETVRANRLIDFLRDNPFVAIVFTEEGNVQVFVRADMTSEHMRQIRDALSDLIKEPDGKKE